MHVGKSSYEIVTRHLGYPYPDSMNLLECMSRLVYRESVRL